MEWILLRHVHSDQWSLARSCKLSYHIQLVHQWSLFNSLLAAGWMVSTMAVLDMLLTCSCCQPLVQAYNLCSEFMKKKSLKFSTNINPVKSKTKCVIFSKKEKDRVNVIPVKLNGNDLPWIREVKHPGNILECDSSMVRDIPIKRGNFIWKLIFISQEFFYASPNVFLKILNIYAVSFHGSGLWNLFSKDCERLYKAWNVAVRHAWKIPNTTHRYLIEELSGFLHPKVMLASRYIGFVSSLSKSPKYSVRVLDGFVSSDLRTVMGRTLAKISNECGEPGSLTPRIVKKNMKYFPVPVNGELRFLFFRSCSPMNLRYPASLRKKLMRWSPFSAPLSGSALLVGGSFSSWDPKFFPFSQIQ